MNILITGSGGQVGTELQKCLALEKTDIGQIPCALQNARITAIDVDKLDITKLNRVQKFVAEQKPDVIFNCAAYTNVDACESNVDDAFSVNAVGARNLAISAAQAGAKLVHISTDYIFAGDGNTPYSEWDICCPKNIYGHTKQLGEDYVLKYCHKSFVVRTSWLYGLVGINFVKNILKLANGKKSIKVVNDQRGNPTNAADLVHHLLKLAATEEYGIYHCTNNGECSWYDFACAFIQMAGLDCEVQPCTSEEFPRPAKRPAYSSLDNRMLRCTIGDEMRTWREALESYMLYYDKESGEIKA